MLYIFYHSRSSWHQPLRSICSFEFSICISRISPAKWADEREKLVKYVRASAEHSIEERVEGGKMDGD